MEDKKIEKISEKAEKADELSVSSKETNSSVSSGTKNLEKNNTQIENQNRQNTILSEIKNEQLESDNKKTENNTKNTEPKSSSQEPKKDSENTETVSEEKAINTTKAEDNSEKTVIKSIDANLASSEAIKNDSTNQDQPNIVTETIDNNSKIEEEKSYIDTIIEEENKYFNKSFWKSFFFDFIFLVICAFLTLVIVQKWLLTGEVAIVGTNQIHSSLESGEKTTIGNINVLVLGVDDVEGTHRSDTIFVLGVIPSKNKITMLSIPRDTRVLIENKGRKINEILPRYGEKVLRKILEDLLKIRISRKVEVGFESFTSVIDSIGGVDINVEKPMHYDDNWGNLHIHFNKGIQHLDGANALRYVRFRKDAMADLGRIKRQQDFVKAVVEKLFSPSCLIKLPSIIEKSFKHIKTDFTLQEILTLAKGFNSIKVSFRTLSLPGEPRYIDRISFFLPYSDEAVSIGNSYFSDLSLFEIETNFSIYKNIKSLNNSNRKNK